MEGVDANQKQNAGGRIERFIVHAISRNQDATTMDALGYAFDLPGEIQGLDRQHRLADLTTSVITELRRMKAALSDQGVPADLLEPYTSRAEHALSIGNLNNPWKLTISNYLGADVLLALKWYGFVLPDDSATSSSEEVYELAGLLKDLEETLEKPGIPAGLAQFIRKQVDSIRKAVWLFPIAGVAPIRAAARAMAADIHIDDDEIRAMAQRGDAKAVAEVGGKLKKTWEKAVHIAGDLDKLSKAGKAVLEVGDLVAKLIAPSP